MISEVPDDCFLSSWIFRHWCRKVQIVYKNMGTGKSWSFFNMQIPDCSCPIFDLDRMWSSMLGTEPFRVLMPLDYFSWLSAIANSFGQIALIWGGAWLPLQAWTAQWELLCCSVSRYGRSELQLPLSWSWIWLWPEEKDKCSKLWLLTGSLGLNPEGEGGLVCLSRTFEL